MSSNNRRIQRVPALLIAEDEKKKNDYYPMVASIGPYHYRKPDLAQVEAFKPVAVDLLVRGEKDFFYQKVLAKIDQIRNCYEEKSVDKYSDADLAQMMLRDASLIIAEMEIYLEHGETYHIRKAMIDHFGRLTGAVLFRDFILVENQIPLWVIQLLIELRHGADKGLEMINKYVNKCIFGEIRLIVDYSPVPLHLLELMHSILVYGDEAKESSRESYSTGDSDMAVMAPNLTLLLGSPQHAPKTSNRSDEESSSGELGASNFAGAPNHTIKLGSNFVTLTLGSNFAGAPNHTLKLGSRKHATETSNWSIDESTSMPRPPNDTLIMGSPQRATKTSNNAKKVTRSFRKVMELKARGIHFRPSATQSLLDVKFKPGFFHATLQLPEMFVSHYSKPFFKNLVAYELLPGVETEPTVTSYINLMQSLVERPEDLKELRERKIVYNQLGGDEEALNVFKDINTHGANDDGLYFIVNANVQAHYNNRIKTWIAELIHTHFRSPWTFTAFLAAAAIIALTAAQLYYDVHPVADKTPT